ncbi:MAG: DMT family transporter, partial [Chloroflexi bacterium]|nr:DMT family transporter [Chloroflexota bacterium]
MERTWSTIQSQAKKGRVVGINAALFSAFFLGLAPIFGKQAIQFGLHPLAVVALRTVFATILLFIGILIFQRRFLYIYPAGLIGCLLAGWINGVGSLFYYSALGHIDAGLGQLLYSIYPLFVAVWMFFDKQPPSRLTILRLLIVLPAIYLLVQANGQTPSIIGVVEMLIAAALFALHLPINQ